MRALATGRLARTDRWNGRRMGRGLIQKDVLFGPQTDLVIAIGIALANAELAIPFVANDSSGIASAHDPLVAVGIASPGAWRRDRS